MEIQRKERAEVFRREKKRIVKVTDWDTENLTNTCDNAVKIGTVDQR